MSRERPPVNDDWWYVRSASIMKKIATYGPVGVSKLRKKYGSKKNRGHKPEKRFDASGNIIRKVLQQLETAELIKKGEAGVHKGRILAIKGTKLLNSVAKSLLKVEKKPGVVEEIKAASEEKPKEAPKQEAKSEPKVEEKKPEVKEEAKPAEKPAEKPKSE